MNEPLSKKQLYELVWKKPMMEVAKEYGLSDRGLAKLCERNGIPVPPRGWWARKHAGYKVKKAPLIALEPEEPEIVILFKRASFETSVGDDKSKAPGLPTEIQAAMDREFLPKNRVKVPKTLSNPHPLVARWIEEEERRRTDYHSIGYYSKKTGPLERRRRRIISAFLKALEKRGFTVEPEAEYSRFIWIVYERDKIAFNLEEHVRHIRRKLTEEELKDRSYSKQTWTQTTEPSGTLFLRLSSECRRSSYDAKDFKDTDECPLEMQLNNIIAAVIEKIWGAKEKRLAREEAEHRRWEEQKKQWRREELLKAERARQTKLEEKAANWKKAQSIRDYVAAVAEACEDKRLTIDTGKLLQWKKWALTHANVLDPITSQDPLIDLFAESIEE